MEKDYMYEQVSDAIITTKTYRWMEHQRGYESSRSITDFDVLYTQNGLYEITVNNKCYLSRKGDIIILPPGSMLTLKARESSSQFFCHFSMASTEHIGLGADFCEHRLPKERQDLVPVYDRAANDCRINEPSAAFLLILKIFLLNMVEGYEGNYILFLNEKVTYLPQEVLTAINYIHEHLSENVTTEKLASLAGFNTAYFSRYFRKYMGISPVHYNTKYRLNYSRHLVVATDHSFKEIAALTGFTDQFAFSKRFKEYYGLSPSELRKVRI